VRLETVVIEFPMAIGKRIVKLNFQGTHGSRIVPNILGDSSFSASTGKHSEIKLERICYADGVNDGL
jgi:hypothetical protein